MHAAVPTWSAIFASKASLFAPGPGTAAQSCEMEIAYVVRPIIAFNSSDNSILQ